MAEHGEQEIDESLPLLQDDQLRPRSSRPTLRITTGSIDLPSPETPSPDLDQEYIKRLLRKIDRRLLPLMFITLTLNSMDKTILGNASLYGLAEDINLSGSRFSTVASMFFIGYLFWEYPSTVLIQALPVGVVAGLTIFTWGLMIACTAFSTTFGHLIVTRLLAGILEAATIPSFLYITTQWYIRDEVPRKVGAWFAGISAGGVLGNLLSLGVAHLEMKPWRWLYVFIGSVTISWAIIIFLFLPNNVSTASYFSPTEKDFVERRMGTDSIRDIDATGDDWSIREAAGCLLDLKTWLLMSIVFLGQVASGGLQSHTDIVLEGFEYSINQSSLIGISFWIISLIVVLGSGFLASRYKNITTFIMAGVSLMSLVGYMFMLLGYGRAFRLAGYLLTAFAYTITPLTLSLVACNVRSITQKMATTALILIASCVANIIGPQLFPTSDNSAYHPTFIIMAMLHACQCIMGLSLRIYLWRCNKNSNNEDEANRPDTPIIRESGVPSPVITCEPGRRFDGFRHRL